MNLTPLETAVPKAVMEELPAVIERFGISRELELAHFLGQCHHESGGFKRVFENLNYSAERLRQVFPSRYGEGPFAEVEQFQPELIANRVYYHKIGNGSMLTGDGWKFRGRGYIQITGRSNYQKFDKLVPEDIMENPDLVATKYPLFSAGWFWSSRRIGDVIGQSVTDSQIKRVTKLVNGGQNGLIHRAQMTHHYFNILTG